MGGPCIWIWSSYHGGFRGNSRLRILKFHIQSLAPNHLAPSSFQQLLNGKKSRRTWENHESISFHHSKHIEKHVQPRGGDIVRDPNWWKEIHHSSSNWWPKWKTVSSICHVTDDLLIIKLKQLFMTLLHFEPNLNDDILKYFKPKKLRFLLWSSNLSAVSLAPSPLCYRFNCSIYIFLLIPLGLKPDHFRKTSQFQVKLHPYIDIHISTAPSHRTCSKANLPNYVSSV